jgi:DNA mismatch repair protein MutS2
LIYPANFEFKIGFEQIRELVRTHCLFEPGRRKVDAANFITEFSSLQEILGQTAEFKEICLFEENFPTENYHDLEPGLRKIRVEGTFLETEEVFRLKRSLETIRSILKFFSSTPAEKYTRLRKMAGEIKYFSYVDTRIDAIMSKQGLIKDSASNELKRIRTELMQKQALVSKRLYGLLKKAIDEGFIDKEAALSMRNGRQVIPVPVFNKRKISGIVHDESATGRTVFIEPAEVVELNNGIRELEIAEQREIIKILVAFADTIRPYVSDLMTAFDFLGTIDFIRAKALFAIRIGAELPALVNEPGFRWKQAVHPLLLMHHRKENKEVVPLDIYLDEKNRMLIISGPNAGGKSVCLKTVGLLQYMFQCGFLVPMAGSSEIGIFKNILIDIGDEQSIENDLSTYSSHLLNMKNFLRNASAESLVLIDEFGSGTEPHIGGAIAEAILESLNAKSVFAVITTHYSNLKHFASSVPGVVNGAMQFDTAKMKPRYILEIGKPGSSFAIDIARQIGLPEDILKSAANKVGEDHINFDRHLREILRDKHYWTEKRNRIRISEKRLLALLEQYEKEIGAVKKLRNEILEEAEKKASELLVNANKEIEKTIRVIRESQADKEKTRLARQELDGFRDTKSRINGKIEEKLDQKIQEVRRHTGKYKKEEKQVEKEDIPVVQYHLQPGDRVFIKGLQAEGEVLEISGEHILVSYGESIITSVKKNKLEKIAGGGETIAPNRSGIYDMNFSQRKLNFRPEIDIRGKRGEEALEIVRHFIDDAMIVGVSELRILHGKGNGVLKNLVREYLNTLDVVRSCKDEHEERGGAGITIIKLDF